jgi:hypothetical protein
MTMRFIRASDFRGVGAWDALDIANMGGTLKYD